MVNQIIHIKEIDGMTTDELSYYRSEIVMWLKPYYFKVFSEPQKKKFRELKRLKKRIDRKLNARQLRLTGF